MMPIDGGERAGLLVTLFLVLISMYLAAVQIAPKGMKVLLFLIKKDF